MPTLLQDIFEYFEQFADSVKQFNACVALITLLTTIISKEDLDPSFVHRVSKLASRFLQREWNETPKV